MIDVQRISRRFGSKEALTGVSFSAPNGSVTGFVGPNGAGKSTLLRIVTGLDRPDAGTVSIDGVEQPPGAARSNVGALLDASWVHSRRTASDHLLALALLQGLPTSRVGEVLEVTGLGHVAQRRIGQFSLGMRQRLGIAAALLSRPTNVILDEPINGLDPDGITWVRRLARDLAGQGAAVLMSSHLLAELAQTADRIVVIGRGRIVGSGPISDFVHASDQISVVRSDDDERLAVALVEMGRAVDTIGTAGLRVHAPTDMVGRVALQLNVALINLTPEAVSLEDRFRELTANAVEYRAAELESA